MHINPPEKPKPVLGDLGDVNVILPGVLGVKWQKSTLGNLLREYATGGQEATENTRKSCGPRMGGQYVESRT
jgi:hypothetical protein